MPFYFICAFPSCERRYTPEELLRLQVTDAAPATCVCGFPRFYVVFDHGAAPPPEKEPLAQGPPHS